MLGIRTVACATLSKQRTTAVRSSARSAAYGYLRDAEASALLPFAMRDVPDVLHRRFEPSAEREVTVAPPALSSADLAVRAAVAAVAPLAELDRSAISWVIVCQSTVDENVSGSVATRVADTLGLDTALPFSITQTSSCGVIMAMRLLDDLLKPGELALVVAVEKLLYPMLRLFGDCAAFGDAAAATVLSRDSYGCVVQCPAIYGDNAFAMPFNETICLSDAYAISLGSRLARYIGTLPATFSQVIPPGLACDVIARAHAGATVTLPLCSRVECHSGSADPLVRLFAERPREPTILWCAGLGADFGACMILNAPAITYVDLDIVC